MEKVDLIQFINDIGSNLVLDSGEYLFRQGDDDRNIYCIMEGNVMLEKDGFAVVELTAGELIGEKSFIDGTIRPVSAKVIENSTRLLVFSKETFDGLPAQRQVEVMKGLSLFLSNRIYKLNSVLSFINMINDVIIEYTDFPVSEKLVKLVKSVINIEGYIILKYEFETFSLLAGDMSYDDNIELFMKELLNKGFTIKVGKNYVYIKSGNYLYLFSGEIKTKEYIITNALIYANSMFKYLGEKIDQNKQRSVLNNSGF